MVGHCRDTRCLGAAVGHCRDTWCLGTAGILCGWHCKDTLRLGTARILGGSALQGYLAVRHCKDALRLGTAGILCGGAVHEYSRQRARTTLTLKSNNPTVRVGNKHADPKISAYGDAMTDPAAPSQMLSHH